MKPAIAGFSFSKRVCACRYTVSRRKVRRISLHFVAMLLGKRRAFVISGFLILVVPEKWVFCEVTELPFSLRRG